MALQSGFRAHLLRHLGQARSSAACSVTLARTRGREITCRRRPHHPSLKGCLAIGTTGRDVFYFMGGLLPAPGKAVGALPAFLLGAGWPVGFDPSGRCPLFQTGFQTAGWRLCLPFQLSDACFERASVPM